MRRRAEACKVRASTVAAAGSLDGPPRRLDMRDGGRRAARPGNRIPRGVGWQIGAKQVGVRPAGLAADAVTVSHQAADFQRRKAIQVGADVGRLPLDFGVHGRRILGLLDHVGNRGEHEAGRVLETFRSPVAKPGP